MVKLVRNSRGIMFAFAFMTAATVACAGQQAGGQQSAAQQPEIRGVVLEYGTALRLNGVQVLLFKEPPDGTLMTASLFTKDKALHTTTTAPDGTFRFTPSQFGAYRVSVSKEGYGSAGPLASGSTTHVSATTSKERPVANLRLTLGRPAEVTGRILDEESEKPVPVSQVLTIQTHYKDGRRLWMHAGAAMTNSAGQFTFEKLTPGAYIFLTRPRGLGSERLLSEFSPEDRKAVEAGYALTFWGGGVDLDSVLPTPVGSGSRLDLGTIRVRRVPLYRVHVTIPEGGCEDTARVDVRDSVLKMPFDVTVQCGKSFLLRGFAPGPYTMNIVSGQSLENRARAVQTFHVIDENVDVVAPLVRGVDLDGRVTAAEGAAKPPIQDLSIRLGIIDLPLRRDEFVPALPDAEGRFRISNVQIWNHRLDISGVPSTHYIKELRYNGSRLKGETLTLDAYATGHRLDIVIDDKPSVVAGTVTDGREPVYRPYVAVIPAADAASPWPLRGGAGDDDGKFRLAGLPPGEYRVVAVASASRSRLEEPGVVAELAGRAKTITLAPNGFQNVTLEIIELQ